MNNQEDWALDLKAYGETATAVVNYRGKSYLHGGPKHYGARNVVSLYDQGAIRNIARSMTTCCKAAATTRPCTTRLTTR